MTTTLHQTIGAQLTENARLYPDQDALVFTGSRRYSWQQLDVEVTRTAAGLLAAGLAPGEHLALWSPNCPEWALVFLAAARIGAVVVSLDTALQGPELKNQLDHSDAVLLFMATGVKQDEYVEIVDALCPDGFPAADLPLLRSVVLFGPARSDYLSFERFVAAGSALPAQQVLAIAERVTAEENVNIQYTSAAFGTPRGVLLSQAAILKNGAITGRNLNFSHNDRLCLPLPFFHAFGCSLGLMLCLAHGATLVVLDRFTPDGVLQALANDRCTALHGVPAMFLAVLESDQFAGYDLSSLRTGIMAGAPCPEALMVDVINRMHAREMTIAYGQTEAGPLLTQTPVDEPAAQRVASVGRPLAGVEIKLVDPVTAVEAADGAEGEIRARSDMLMRGYYKMPDETAQSLDPEGWLHTGDLGVRTPAGCYKITGRLRNMIIRGGQNVYPAEIERCLREHPEVDAVQVYGLPDRKMGESVAARIVLVEGGDVSADAIRAFCQGKIAHYKIPSSIEFVSSL